MNRILIEKICLSSVCLALALILPLFTAQIPTLGKMMLPMHIPVMLCGFICGFKYGLLVGFLSPILRFVIFGMPVIYPIGISMSFELATYGLLCGLTMFKTNKIPSIVNIIITLLIACILGRIIYGLVMWTITFFDSSINYGFGVFLTGVLLSSWPGLIIQFIIIPPLVYSIRKMKLFENSLID